MPVDNQLLVGRAFLACWGVNKQFGWRYTISSMRSNIGGLFGGLNNAEYSYISETLNCDDIAIVQKIIDSQVDRIQIAVNHHNRFDHEFKRTRTLAHVAKKAGYGEGKSARNRCMRDMDTVALVVYGRLLPRFEKIGGATSEMIKKIV